MKSPQVCQLVLEEEEEHVSAASPLGAGRNQWISGWSHWTSGWSQGMDEKTGHWVTLNVHLSLREEVPRHSKWASPEYPPPGTAPPLYAHCLLRQGQVVPLLPPSPHPSEGMACQSLAQPSPALSYVEAWVVALVMPWVRESPLLWPLELNG